MATVFTSPFPDVVIPAATITDQAFRHASRLAERDAVVDDLSGRRYTYGQLRGAVMATAGGLGDRSIGKGDVVAILSPNLPEYAIAFHAVAVIGGIVTTINPSYTVAEIATQLADSRARAIFTVSTSLKRAQAAAKATDVEQIFVIGERDGAVPLAELMASEPYDASHAIDRAADVVALPYSSGTTGLPKGVQLTHRNLVANLVQYERTTTIDENDVVLAVLPFFHI